MPLTSSDALSCSYWHGANTSSALPTPVGDCVWATVSRTATTTPTVAEADTTGAACTVSRGRVACRSRRQARVWRVAAASRLNRQRRCWPPSRRTSRAQAAPGLSGRWEAALAAISV
jgi:hypothetical protein